MNSVGEEFFETLRIPLLAGRTLQRRDMSQTADAVVVDEVFAKRYFPNESPLGRRFGFGPENNRYEIVGVAGNSRYNNLRDDVYPTIYQAFVPTGTIHFAIRSSIDSGRLVEAVRRAVAAVDPAVPLTEFHTQTALIDRLLRPSGFGLRLWRLRTGCVDSCSHRTRWRTRLRRGSPHQRNRSSHGVGRRRRRCGPNGVSRFALDGRMGIVIGLPCAYVIGRVLKTALFRLEPLDPGTAALAFVALLAVALLAAWVPARRAARIDPMTALREE